MKRTCFLCNTPLTLCMGFVLAGDFLKALKGEIPWTDIREICGKCGLYYLLQPYP